MKRICVFQGGAEAGSTDWKWGVSKSTIQGCIIVFGVAEMPAGVAEKPAGLQWASSNLLRDDDVHTVAGCWRHNPNTRTP